MESWKALSRRMLLLPLLRDTNQKRENPVFNAITPVGYILKLTEYRSRSLTLNFGYPIVASI